MKKTLLLFLSFLATIAIQAQTFELTWDGETLGETVVINAEPSVGEVIFDPLVTNLTSSDINVKVRRTNVSVVEGSENYFCWVACYAPFIDESSEYYTMVAGSTTDQDFFSAHYTPLGMTGVTIVEYLFFNVDDESQNLKVTVEYTVNPIVVIPFELTWDGETLGDTVVIDGDTNEGEVVFNPLFTNLTGSDINIKVRRTNVNVVEGTENYFCWVSCYAPFIDESSDYYLMLAGSTTDPDFFSAHYTPLGLAGISTVEYMFFNMDDESQNLKVVVEYNINEVVENAFELTVDGEVVDDVIEIIADPSVGEMIFDPLVTNTTNATMNVKVRRTNVSVVEGTENYFCWVSCYAPFVDESNDFFEMAPGQTTEPDFFSAHYTPMNMEGTTTVEYTFYNMDDETESYTITVNYKAEPNSISESVANGVQFDNIFPNPASNYVNINYTLVPEVYKGNVRITNLLGAVVSETPIDLNSNSMKIDVSNLDGGIYFYSVVLNGEILHSKKLIIK